jgi:hypothetical protein
VKLPVCDFATVMSGMPLTVVGSVSVLLKLFDAGSPPPETVAEFVTEGNAAAATATVTVIAGAVVAPAIEARVQVAVLLPITVLVQVQPVPVGVAATVKPAGKLSVTVTVALVAVLAALFTVIVYVPLTPTVKFPACVLLICSSGAPVIESESVALLFPAPVRDRSVGSETPLAGVITRAVFASVPLAVGETVPETVYVTEELAGRLAVVLIALPLPLPAPQVAPPVAEPQVQVTPVIVAGTVSVTIDPVDASGPALLTTIV